MAKDQSTNESVTCEAFCALALEKGREVERERIEREKEHDARREKTLEESFQRLKCKLPLLKRHGERFELCGHTFRWSLPIRVYNGTTYEYIDSLRSDGMGDLDYSSPDVYDAVSFGTYLVFVENDRKAQYSKLGFFSRLFVHNPSFK